MKFKRIWVLFLARNREFLRDRSGFGWNILFPFLIVAGFGLIYNSDGREVYKVGIFPVKEIAGQELYIPGGLADHPLLRLIPFETGQEAMEKLRHHKVAIVVENRMPGLRYWINDASPQGAVAEIIVREASLDRDLVEAAVDKQEIPGVRIRYIDWLFPGILGMNIMFSAFFGVSYVIARYRRNGVLKRLKATPVTAFEYLTSQLLSRVAVLVFSSVIVWIGCDFLFSFHVLGAWTDLCLVFLAGICCMVAFGLVVACRGTNEELTNGIINFISWPMMFLSEVWFSIEGAAPWVRGLAECFPLTHFLRAARLVINEGAGLAQVSVEMTAMAGFSIVFLLVGAYFFSWTR
ncbi:MAG: ABC transporter permease [Desulfobacterales bacterium]|nr:ABC transporter permease [Desulfobacterales bacterium]